MNERPVSVRNKRTVSTGGSRRRNGRKVRRDGLLSVLRTKQRGVIEDDLGTYIPATPFERGYMT